MKGNNQPSSWQKKAMWAALTALSVAVIFSVSVGFIYLFSRVMSFLQPILVPFAVAGVLAYLLEPAVVKMMKWGTTRERAVWAVFGITSLAFASILVWIIPSISIQSERLAKKVPEMAIQLRIKLTDLTFYVRDKYGLQIVPEELLSKHRDNLKELVTKNGNSSDKPENPPAVIEPSTPEVIPKAILPNKNGTTKPGDENVAKEEDLTGDKKLDEEPETAALAVKKDPAPAVHETALFNDLLSGNWVRTTLPTVIGGAWKFLGSSLGGFLGIFGLMLSFVIVPLYLYYFLTESHNISTGWSQYLPLKASHFKDEVVETLIEVNGYLIAFFRGQLVVSLINGTATAIGLVFIGLDFGILIGLALCVLGVIPYIGIAVCWIPAVIIAMVQGGNSWLIPADAAWWVFPLVTTAVFAVVQQIDGLFITPKIVGESVGLHPVTVIFSVFLWSLLLGGLLGAILAVPLTATVKVLLRRYVWERSRMTEDAKAIPVSENPT